MVLSFRSLACGPEGSPCSKSTAGLPETLRRFLGAESVDVGALFAQPRGEAGEIAVRRHQTESIEPPAVQKVHGIDHKGDVGCVLARGVGELLIGIDGMFSQDTDPGFKMGAGEITVNPAHAGLTEGGDLFEKTFRDLRRGVVAVDQDRKAGQALFDLHARILFGGQARSILGHFGRS